MNAEMTRDEMLALLASQKAMIDKLAAEANKPKRITMKVTEKGGMSLYGLGRFPVTLYKSQWDALLANADAIRAFLAANAHLLAVKAG